MKVSSFSNISDLFARLQSNAGSDFLQQSGRGLQNEKARNAIESARQRQEARRASHKNNQDGQDVTIQPVDTPQQTDPANTSPAGETQIITSEELSIDDLAGLYVRQYEQQSGVRLSKESFDQKKSEVSSFYSGMSDGRDRLDKIVFSNDSENNTVVA